MILEGGAVKTVLPPPVQSTNQNGKRRLHLSSYIYIYIYTGNDTIQLYLDYDNLVIRIRMNQQVFREMPSGFVCFERCFERSRQQHLHLLRPIVMDQVPASGLTPDKRHLEKLGGEKRGGATWRIIPISKWLITMVGNSPK